MIMRWQNLITTLLSLLMAIGAMFYPLKPASWIVAGIFALIAAYAATVKVKPAKNEYIVRLKGFAWKYEDFCRGWLITGDTGSGKTRSGINQLLFQVFRNDPQWGGLCIDDKGVYWETLVEMAATFQRQNDLILLQVKPDDAPHDWKPRHTFNLLSDSSIPPSTYAKFVVDTVTSLGQKSEQSFFKNQAQTHIGLALELLSRMEMEVSLQNIRNFLLEEKTMNSVLKELETDFPTGRDNQLKEHFEQRYRGQPAEQMGGVKETIANYLQFFLTPDIAQIFCSDKNSFDFKDIDRGKIICVAMPQNIRWSGVTLTRFSKCFSTLTLYAGLTDQKRNAPKII